MYHNCQIACHKSKHVQPNTPSEICLQIMCVSRKYPHRPLQGSGHWRLRKPEFFKGKCETKLKFPEGWVAWVGCKQKTPWVGYGYFLEQHIFWWEGISVLRWSVSRCVGCTILNLPRPSGLLKQPLHISCSVKENMALITVIKAIFSLFVAK